MTIHEPATLLTDFVLAALGGGFALRLPRGSWWRRSMGLMAVSAVAGGLYHGFAPEVPAAVESGWWRLVLWIICGLGFAMGMSLLHEIWPHDGTRRWRCLLLLKLALSAVVVGILPHFAVAMIDYGLPMLAWAVAALAMHRPWRAPMLAGVGLSVLAGVIQQRQWGLSGKFNHNDVFHLVQAFALVAFYLAGRRLRGTPAG